VLIAPSTSGDPVALTPALGPHDEVPVEAVALLAPPELLDEPPLLGGALVVELLLLPHPASAASATSAIRASTSVRSRGRSIRRSVLKSPPRFTTHLC
jgi:hypothetical protein